MAPGRLALGLILATTVSCAPRETDETADAAMQDTFGEPTAEWVTAEGLPPGAQLQVVSGDPGQAGPFVARLRLPDDYRVPPHSHPAAETVTVVSGTLHVGWGETFDLSGDITELRQGQSIDVAANAPHFAHAAGETVIEVRSTGPFQVNYVNPADDPSR